MDKEDYGWATRGAECEQGSVICTLENITLRAQQVKKLAVSLKT